jgi:hypothetical protein
MRGESLRRAARVAKHWVRSVEPAPRLRFPERFRSQQPSPYSFPVELENPLEALGRRYRPSKRLHHYLPFYWMHFRDIRDRVRNVCEIGVQTDRSIRMWEEFFPHATIWGLDIDPKVKALEGGRCRIRIGDQSDHAFLARVLDEVEGGFDIVIDDASHKMRHQLITFNALFPALTDHGVYVIEDTGGLTGCSQSVERMKEIVDHIMCWPPDWDSRQWLQLASHPDGASWADRNAIGIAFYRWLVFVFRGHNPEDNPHLTRA